MPTIIVKNTSGGDLVLEDFGIELIASAQRTLSDDFQFAEIASSDKLKTQVSDGDITINDGTSDLSISDGLGALTIESKYEDEAGGSGQSWVISSSPPASPINGAGWFNTNAQMLYIWDSTRGSWLTPRFPVYFALSKNSKNKYLSAPVGYSNPDGHIYLPRDITICSIQIRIRILTSNTDAGIAIEEDYVNKDEVLISGATGWRNFSYNPSNIKISSGKKLQVYCWSNKGISDPFVELETAWRVDP